MNDDKAVMDRVDASYKRCRLTGVFPHEFYENFLSLASVYPDYRDALPEPNELDDWKTLDQGIRCLILYYCEPTPRIAEKLYEFGRTALNVKLELYDVWFSVLLKTVAANDDAYDEALERDWKRVIEHGIRAVIQQRA